MCKRRAQLKRPFFGIYKVYNNINKTRLFSILVFFILSFTFLFFKLFFLQIIQYQKLNRIAKNQHNIFVELEPVRGTIYDRNMRKLAFNIAVDSVWANPRDIKEKEKVSELLSPILKIEKSQILQKLQKDKGFIWLSRKIPPDSSLKIKSLKLRETFKEL